MFSHFDWRHKWRAYSFQLFPLVATSLDSVYKYFHLRVNRAWNKLIVLIWSHCLSFLWLIGLIKHFDFRIIYECVFNCCWIFDHCDLIFYSFIYLLISWRLFILFLKLKSHGNISKNKWKLVVSDFLTTTSMRNNNDPHKPSTSYYVLQKVFIGKIHGYRLKKTWFKQDNLYMLQKKKNL